MVAPSISQSASESRPKEHEPALKTAPELQGVPAELSGREPIFHRAEFGTTRADFERMTAEDYWETGASGRRYSIGLLVTHPLTVGANNGF